MDCLARREHSHFELQRKLRLKFPELESSLIHSVLVALREEGLQSDTRFVESFIRYRKSRGFGYLHIKADLQTRGVSEQLLATRLFADDADWEEIASALIERKLPAREALVFASREHRRLLRFLASRGFTQDLIRRLIDPLVQSDKQAAESV